MEIDDNQDHCLVIYELEFKLQINFVHSHTKKGEIDSIGKFM